MLITWISTQVNEMMKIIKKKILKILFNSFLYLQKWRWQILTFFYFLDENMNVNDYGNVTYSLSAEASNQNVTNMLNYPHISACNFQLSRSTEQIIGEGRICLTLGGDHSIGEYTRSIDRIQKGQQKNSQTSKNTC